MSLFAKNLRFLRKQRGVNQKEVALLFQKQANTIGNWENGKSEPSIGELIKLAEYFNVGMQQLLHADLQKAAIAAINPLAYPDIQETASPHAYPVNDSGTSLAQDDSHDSFWLILRELKSINEKLEDLKQNKESGPRRPGSDKSYH
jgi:transcriptional regulator with XRE-family HTH domain